MSARPTFIPREMFRRWMKPTEMNKYARIDSIMVSSYIARCARTGRAIKSANQLYRFIDVVARAFADSVLITPQEAAGIQINIQEIKKELEKLTLQLNERKHFVQYVDYGLKLTGKIMLTHDEIISCKNKLFIGIGVYFLIKDNHIVYVGQSINLFSRIATHLSAGEKEFDSYAFLPCEKCNLNIIESLYIQALRPPLNGSQGQVRFNELIIRINEKEQEISRYEL